MLGDWGGIPVYPYYSANQMDAATVMARIASERNAHFLLTFGDNFYMSGVTDVNDRRFKVVTNLNENFIVINFFYIDHF